MMADRFGTRKKLTNEEIIASITFLAEIGNLDDEALKKRGLQIGDAQKVNNFLSAVGDRESTCLPKQAMTLLRLTPLLLDRGSITVHHVLLSATPRVVKAYQETTDLNEKRSLANALKTAGMVCVNRRLGPTLRDDRKQELQMYEPFIGQTPEYREAKARYTKRFGYKGKICLQGKEAVNAVRLSPYGRIYWTHSSRE